MLAKKTVKNQLTLPKEIVKKFPGVEYFDIKVKDNKIFLVPVMITPLGSTIERIRDRIKKRGITKKDVNDAIKWARKR